jgi:hypothetical protein
MLIGFPDHTHFTVVQCSVTNASLWSNSKFHFQCNILKVNHICESMCTVFIQVILSFILQPVSVSCNIALNGRMTGDKWTLKNSGGKQLLPNCDTISLFMYLYLYIYFNSINTYWLPKPSDIEHVTYAYISSKNRTSHLTTTFMKENWENTWKTCQDSQCPG